VIVLALVVMLVGLAALAVGLYFLGIIRLIRHQSERDAVVVALPLVVVANLSMDVWRALVSA
jgi:hypothetical protein